MSKISFFENFKKTTLYVLLTGFIILNFLDFLNMFSLISNYEGDVDFFKKLLSWFLIYYLFATISITKVITGFKDKKYDIILLIAYGLVAIPSILVFYLKSVNFSEYYIFSFIVNPQFLILVGQLNFIFLMFGLTLMFVTSLLIFVKLPIHKESFIGSFNFDYEKYFPNLYKILLILCFNLFFAFTFFKFFMEWFALAIDAALLVVGFGYYIHYHFIQKKSPANFKLLIDEIVNTGNAFFKQLVLYLQDKKTFFIGISILLTIHLLVDIGVYLIPFATGIDNGLYNILGTPQDDIRPLFALEGSWLHIQFYELFINENLGNMQFFFQILVLAIEGIFYIENLLLYTILLSMPFILLATSLRGKLFIPSKKLIIFTLVLVFLQLCLYVAPNYNNSIEFSFSNSNDDELGIVFVAQPLFEYLNSATTMSLTAQISTIIALHLIILFFVFIRYEKFKSFWISTFYISILVFFLFYSTVFAQNYIGVLYEEQFGSNHLQFNSNMFAKSKLYNKEAQIIQNEGVESTTLQTLANEFVIIHSDWYRVIDFKNNSKSYNLVGLEIDFLKNMNTHINFKELNTNEKFKGVEVYVYNYSSYFEKNNIKKNKKLDNKAFVILKFKDVYINSVIDTRGLALSFEVLEFLSLKQSSTPYFQLAVSLFSLFIVSLFYIGGLIAYAVFYRNALERLKRELF